MREPVVDSGDGQTTADDDLVSGLIDDCAGQLEKNNLWDANTTSSIKHFSDIYNIASQEGDDDDDDSLSFDRLLGHARLEKCSMESWMAGISSSDAEAPPPTGINILAATSAVLRPLIPAAMVPAGILGSVNGGGGGGGVGLSQDLALMPMARPLEQVTLIPVNEHSAKLAFAPAAHGDLPSSHIPNVLVSQNMPVTVPPSSQSSASQVWTSSVSNGDANRTSFSAKSQMKPSRSRANRPKVEMAKPAMNEKESHELERVMDILKRYKQQLAESDQIGQFLPCKRKRSKPPSQCTDSSGSYPKSTETTETLEHEKTVMPDLTNSKYAEKSSVSHHLPATINYRYDAKAAESKAQMDVNDGVGLMAVDGGGTTEVRVHSNMNMANPMIYANILTTGGNDSVSSFSPGNSYGGTPPVSVLQCSPGTVDPTSRCTSVGVDYQLDSAQGLARYQNQLPPTTRFPCSLATEASSAEAGLMKLPNSTETENASMANSLLCVQRISVPGVDQRASDVITDNEPMSALFAASSKKSDFMSNLTMDDYDDVNLSTTKLTQEQIRQNTAEPVPACTCLASSGVVFDETKEGPYYTQLGAAESVAKIREIMERRFRLGITDTSLRIEKIIYTGKEGKNPMGCPAAKWIIRRSSDEEKVLCLVRKRPGHTCDTAVLVIGIVVWDGISDSQRADSLFDSLTQTLSLHGLSTERRCGSNDQKTCCCQGWDPSVGGASFTFGCSWSMFYNGCKFAKSSVPRKFRLKRQQEEERLDRCLNQLASDIAPLYARAAPDSFSNQTQAGSEANDCRLGNTKQKPWSGVTAVVDYCTHSHKDINNMQNGCVAVVTLTKHRSSQGKPEDEQLHVLPLYVMDSTDEFDSVDGQRAKVVAGAVECLTKFPSVMRIQQQKTNCHPRRNYRNKSKSRGVPAEKTVKKVAVVPRKRLRPSRATTTRVTSLKSMEVALKGHEGKLEGQASGSHKDGCIKSEAQSGHDDTIPCSMGTVGEEFDLTVDTGDAQATSIESMYGGGISDDNGKVKIGGVGAVSNSLSYGGLYPDGSSRTGEQQVFSQTTQQNTTASQLHSDAMEPFNAWSSRIDGGGSDTKLQKPQQIPNDNSLLWTLDGGGDSDGMDVGESVANGNQWMKRIESASDLRNHGNAAASEDNDLLTVNSIGDSAQILTRSSCPSNLSTSQTVTVVSGRQQLLLVPSAKPQPLSSSVRMTTSEHNSAALNQLAQNMTNQQVSAPASTNEGSTSQPASSSSSTANKSAGYPPQKCGGYLQLLNGDEDMDYADGCLSSHDYYTQYLHASSGAERNQKDEQTLKDPASRSDSKPRTDGCPDVRHEINTENEHLFKDSKIGGVAIALTHGSVLFEVAKREVHATTALKSPNRFAPTRIALVFYQHKHLNHPNHGSRQEADKLPKQEKPRFVEKEPKPFEEQRGDSPDKFHPVSEPEPAAGESSSSQGGSNREMFALDRLPPTRGCVWTAPVNNVHTLTTTTMVTKWIQPKLATSGPYQCWG